MKCRSLVAGFVLAVVAVAGQCGLAEAGGSVPFSGWLQGDVTRTPTDPPPFVSVLVEGEGLASHLGRFTIDIPHLVNPVTRTAAGTYEFVAANGDTLTAEFTGQSTPIEGTTFLWIKETATIIGGTGRFTNATGEFDAVRLFDTSDGTTCGWFDGVISRPRRR